MEPFVVTTPRDDRVLVPFEVPVENEEPIVFALKRMQYLSEDTMRQMRDDLREIDKPVVQKDADGNTIWRVDREGELELDDDGEKLPLMGPPLRTVHERTRVVARTMLKVVVSPEILERLDRLTVGELDQIVGHWSKVSTKPLEGATPGGIFGLLEHLDEHGEAIEADLIDHGLRRRDIGTPDFSWRDFRVWLEARGTESALFRARNPRSWPWSLPVEFLSEILYTLQGANWQRGGGKGDKPKRVMRPDDSKPQLDLSVPVAARQAAMNDELARRRASRDRRRKRQSQPRKSRIIQRVG